MEPTSRILESFSGEDAEQPNKVLALAEQIIQSRRKTWSPKPDVYPPEPDQKLGGFPLFFRLITTHLVGLNQARSKQALEKYLKRFGEYLATKQSTPITDAEEARVYRGGLADAEVPLLCAYIEQICQNYDKVHGQVHK